MQYNRTTFFKRIILFVLMLEMLASIFVVCATQSDAASYYTIRINYCYVNGTPAHDPYIATFTVGAEVDLTVTHPNVNGFVPMVLNDPANDPTELPTGGAEQTTRTFTYASLGGDVTETVYYVPGLTHYAARYYLQNIYDDLYELDRTRTNANQNRVGKTGTAPLDLEEEEITGFTSLFHEPDAIAADGSTVFRVYYDRNYYTVNFDLGEGGYGVEPIYAKYETPFRVDEPQSIGYTFLGWARTSADSSKGDYGDDWVYVDPDYDPNEDDLEDMTWTEANATAPQNLIHFSSENDADQTIPAYNTYYKAIWEPGTTRLSVVYWIENPDSVLKYDGHDYDGLTEEQKARKISQNYSVLTAKDVYQIQRNRGMVDVEAGMTISGTDSIGNYAKKAYDEGYDGATSSGAAVVQITNMFGFNLNYADPEDPRNEDADPNDPDYDPDAPVYKFGSDGKIIDFNDISQGTSEELIGASDFFEMNTAANTDEPLLITDTSVTVHGDGTTRFNVFYRRKTFTLKFYYARQGYTSGVLDPNKISLTNSTKQFNYKANDAKYLNTTSKNVLEAIAEGSWEPNSAETLPTVKDEYKQQVTEGYEDFVDNSSGYYRYYYYQWQAKYNEPLNGKWLIDALNSVHRKNAAAQEMCIPGSIATEYYNKYYQDRSASPNFTVKGIYEKLGKGILFTDSARATMKQNNIDYTELHFLISWTNTSYTNGWNSSIQNVLHFRYENYTELLPREIEILEDQGTQALLAEGNYLSVRTFTTKVKEDGNWVPKTKWYGLMPEHVYETIDSGDAYKRSYTLERRNSGIYTNQTATAMTGFELEYYRSANGTITLDGDNTEIDWSEDTDNYRRCTIKFFYRRRVYTLKYRNGNRKDEAHTCSVMYGAPINSVYTTTNDGHEINEYRYYWPDPEYFIENLRGYYIFRGWYNDPRYEDAFDLATQTMPADDCTLYAKWTPKVINVVFYNTYDDYYVDRRDAHPEKKIVLNQHEIDEAIENEEEPPAALKVLAVDYGTYVPLLRIPVDDDSEGNIRPQLTPMAEEASFAGWYYIRNRVPVRFEPENVPVTALNAESTGNSATLRLFAEWVTKDVAKYRIKYIQKKASEDDPDVEIAHATIGRAYVWKTRTFYAKTGDELYDEYKWTAEGENDGTNWWPTDNSHSLVVKSNTSGYAPNEYSFEYIQKDKVYYRVRYLDASTRTPLRDDVIRQSTHASVNEDALVIPGYAVEEASMSQVLIASTDADPDEQRAWEIENNVINFLYRENDTDYLYEVEYLVKDLNSNTYSTYATETLLIPIAAQGDTILRMEELFARPMPSYLFANGYEPRYGTAEYYVTNLQGVTDTEHPVHVDDDGSVVITDQDKKRIVLYFDRKQYPYTYLYIDHSAEKAYLSYLEAHNNDPTGAPWNGVIDTIDVSDDPSHVGYTGQEITITPDTDLYNIVDPNITDPEADNVFNYTRITNEDGTLNDVTLTIAADDDNYGLNVVKVYYRKDIERELNYRMVCVNSSEDTDYEEDGTPMFGRLSITMQTVIDYNGISSVTFHDTNNEMVDRGGSQLEPMHLHRYTFLGWYTTPEYDPEHPEVGRLTDGDHPTLTKEDLGTNGELPARDVKYYALVKQDMVKLDIMFYFIDAYDVEGFKAADEDVAEPIIQNAIDNADNNNTTDKVYPTGERGGVEVVFSSPEGYENHAEIPWHRNDGYSLYMSQLDDRVYKYSFCEWWQVVPETEVDPVTGDTVIVDELVRKWNWNNSLGWDPDSLTQQVPRNQDQYLIAVYARTPRTSLDYRINYHFTDRNNVDRTYVIADSLSEVELAAASFGNVASRLTDSGAFELTDEHIMANAPFESNYGEVLVWSDAEDALEKTSVRGDAKEDDAYDDDILITNLYAQQSTKMVTANYRLTPNGQYTVIRMPYGSNRETCEAMNAIDVRDVVINGKTFTYWEVHKPNAAGTGPDPAIAAKCYDAWFSLAMMDNYYITPVFDTPVEGGNTVKLNPAKIAQGNESWAAWTWNEGAESDAYWVHPDADLVFTNLQDKVTFVRYQSNTTVSWNNFWNQTDNLDVIDGHTFTLTHFGEYGTAMYGTWSNVILTWLGYARNRWTDADGNLYPNGNTDLLYTDFEIAFEDGDNQIFDEDGAVPTGYSVGVCFELCDRWPRTAYPGDTVFSQGADYGYASDEAHLKAAISSGAASGNYYYTASTDPNNGGKRRSYQLTAIPTDKLTNRNRIEFAKAYKNAYKVNAGGDITGYTNSTYLMKVTAYLKAPDGYVMLSNPVYICLTDIAARDYALAENIVVLTGGESGD